MNFIKPKKDNNYLVVCEHCKAIINFSKEDCYCVKEADVVSFEKGDFKNVTRIYIECPNCCHQQDVVAGFRYVSDDRNWF